MLLTGVIGFFSLGHWALEASGFGIFGVLLLIVSLIFAVDPTWSFTHDWQLFRGVNWDAVWPVALIVAGILLLLPSFFRRQH